MGRFGLTTKGTKQKQYKLAQLLNSFVSFVVTF